MIITKKKFANFLYISVSKPRIVIVCITMQQWSAPTSMMINFQLINLFTVCAKVNFKPSCIKQADTACKLNIFKNIAYGMSLGSTLHSGQFFGQLVVLLFPYQKLAIKCNSSEMEIFISNKAAQKTVILLIFDSSFKQHDSYF